MKCQIPQHDYVTFLSTDGTNHTHAICRRCGHVLFEIDARAKSSEIPFVADKVKKETS